ncbi:tudor domain-containing protein 7B isoform X1 [Scleropages formosus]|uniref:Tudor domain containing 7 a n=2 Tax=Scleropages formosus TaxID=113540 RepID=A0A8C9QP12_SCLFO|nr:tudor domain-containing protein 7 isoform X1 [Scleropages formosus]
MMTDPELVKKMLRAVLQASKSGVSLSRLQAEYKSLTGEFIPHKQLGHSSLDGFLSTIPSVVKMERSRSGEVICFAVVCKETAHVAQLVARQRTNKKAGRPQLVNCQMRVKPAAPFMLNAKPRTSLRQPDRMGCTGRGMMHPSTGGRPAGHGDFRHPEGKVIVPQNKATSVPSRKPPITCEKSDKKVTLPSRFQKEVQAHLSRNPQQIGAPANLNEIAPPVKPRPPQSSSYNQQLVQNRLQEILSKYTNGFWVSKLPHMYRELYKQDFPTEALRDLELWSHICIVEKTCSSNPSELLLYPSEELSTAKSSPASTPSPRQSPLTRKLSGPTRPTVVSPAPSPPSSPAGLSPDVQAKLEELLAKYNSGLWAHALPKLFQDTYKTKFPQRVLDDLSLLEDVCTIDYPMPDNPKKAILYARSAEDKNRNRVEQRKPPSPTPGEPGRPLHMPGMATLLVPKEEYPSVLVVEAASTNSVVIRYIGEGYSQAQETLEDQMREFYRQDNTKKVLTSPVVGQLAAVKAEEEEEILRAQVWEVTADKVKVYYVDHGFSEVIGIGKLLELHDKFFKLPFQAARCKLAGLEPFSQDPAVLKKFEIMACGKILLAEIVEREETPLVVLYDTSQDDDVNINATCMKALQDKSLESPLQVNSSHRNASVTNVCSDGTIYCQLPSRGLSKLAEVLEKTEAYFHSQVTSEFLVSKPFCGKICLARYKGRWSRVEITNLHGSRVLDIHFVDLGIPASVEVIELREVPSPFLRELVAIPPQAVKCCLADLPVKVGSWTPDAVLRLRDAVLGSTECSVKIAKVDESKRLVYVYLYTSKEVQDVEHSVNRQIADTDLWKHQKDVFLTSRSPGKRPGSAGSSAGSSTEGKSSPLPESPPPEQGDLRQGSPASPFQLPPLLELPPVGQNMDVYVTVACHPGHFVLQPWRDQYKLVVLMGEMILFYNKMEERPFRVEKNQICAAKVDNNWHRVLVKGVLASGLASVYELDYGKHELVSCAKLQPLIEEFQQLPFQAVTAQLAGVKPRQWSEEASIVFRNHVEKKPLVAQIEAVHEAPQPWDRKIAVYLVDTSEEERDMWIHDIMSEFAKELTKAA